MELDQKILADVISVIEDKKGGGITLLQLKGISVVTDYCLIVTGNSTTQVKAIAGSIEAEIFKATQVEPWRKEGLEYGEWILLDYVDVVVHVFRTDKREFYGVEDLWGDAEIKYYKSA